MSRMAHGLKHAESPPANGVQRRCRPQVCIEYGGEARGTFGRSTLAPIRICQTLRQHLMMNLGMLAHVDGRQMEAEGTHTAQQSLHIEQPCSPPMMRREALGHQPDVFRELRRGLVLFRQRFIGSAQTLSHLTQEDAIRHAVMTRRSHALHARQTACIFLRAGHQRG